MTRRGCTLLVASSILFFPVAGLILFGPQSCEWVLPDESFEDKDVDCLISKLKSWRVLNRLRAVWNLNDRTADRAKIIAALTDTLLNDSHEEVRSETAQAMARMTPPAAEAVPALTEALYLPANNRGKPIAWYMRLDVPTLPQASKYALESIGTPEALEAVAEFKRTGPTLIESSVPDGASEVDAQFINENGITLRFRGNKYGYCDLVNPAVSRRKEMWTKSFKDNVVTLKPRRNDPKLLNASTYTVDVYVKDDLGRSFRTEITFTTKP